MGKETPINLIDRPNSYVGRTLSRDAAKRAVAGRGRYTDDIMPHRTLHAAFVRSPYGHAKILSIDIKAAQEHPDVALVMTGEELSEMWTGPRVGRLGCFEGLK